MIKIAIYNKQLAVAKRLFNILAAIIKKKVRINCELTFSTDIGKITEKLGEEFNCYDIVFLDATDGNGVALAAKIRRKNFLSSIIFTGNTDYDITSLLRYRPTACIFNFSDIKPIYDALGWSFMEQKQIRPYIIVKNKEALIRVNFSDIYYFESSKRVVSLFTKKKVIKFYSKLGDVMTMLPQNGFIRCHQSYIVNMTEIIGLDKALRSFRLTNGTSIEISKSYYAQSIEEYERFSGLKKQYEKSDFSENYI